MFTRRKFLRALLGLSGGAVATVAVPANGKFGTPGAGRVLLQESPLAGSQFYAWDTVHRKLRVGDVLFLRRNPLNKYDPQAVEVWWGEHMLGHVPRAENYAVSQMMDRGTALTVSVTTLRHEARPWQRLMFEVRV